ncbi:MAG: DUF1573 domain-containing protein [Chitinophagales bacterium]
MKKYILPLLAIAVLGMFSCNEEKVENTETEVKNEVKEIKNEVINATENIKKEVQNNTPAVVANPTTIKMDKMEHDFGTIGDDKNATTTFTITNTGNNPLIISSAKGSCGCTVPTYPKAPIAPGESGTLEVSFDPKGKSGAQNKTVTIIANTEPANTVLNIKSVVNKTAQ